MSTRASIFYHHDERRRIHIHIYKELLGEFPQDIRLEVESEHGTFNVPWPLGFTREQLSKFAIAPDPNRKWFWEKSPGIS